MSHNVSGSDANAGWRLHDTQGSNSASMSSSIKMPHSSSSSLSEQLSPPPSRMKIFKDNIKHSLSQFKSRVKELSPMRKAVFVAIVVFTSISYGSLGGMVGAGAGAPAGGFGAIPGAAVGAAVGALAGIPAGMYLANALFEAFDGYTKEKKVE